MIVAVTADALQIFVLPFQKGCSEGAKFAACTAFWAIIVNVSCLFSLALDISIRFRGGSFQPLTHLSASDNREIFVCPHFIRLSTASRQVRLLTQKLQLGGSSMSCDRNPRRGHALVVCRITRAAHWRDRFWWRGVQAAEPQSPR